MSNEFHLGRLFGRFKGEGSRQKRAVKKIWARRHPRKTDVRRIMMRSRRSFSTWRRDEEAEAEENKGLGEK